MLARDLMDQARHLATVDTGKPKQANLRRAISAAYYALFHLLSMECSRRMGPRTPVLLGAKISRSLGDSEMRQVCKSILSANLSDALQDLQPEGFSPMLRTVAEAFTRLQEARHLADYDTSISYSRTTTLDLIDFAEEAFRAWQIVRSRDEANVFLAALLFANRWSR
jgi:uncharacterized protein (UPF0332 family)